MRRRARPVKVGRVTIGGDAPVSIQSMTKTDTRDQKSTREQIDRLQQAGCELVRVAVPDVQAAKMLEIYKRHTVLPLIADIHFDHDLALLAMEAGADKIRINPGNIGGKDKLGRVVARALEKNVALRIGVNAGSLSREILEKHGGATADALVESALDSLVFMEGLGFFETVISLKASNVATTVQAYKRIADQVTYPLHVGVTEAGRGTRAAVKSAMGIGALLLRGIGDTVRVSLTGDPVQEVSLAKEILQAAGVRHFGPDIISCPTCGRCSVDLEALLGEVERIAENLVEPLTIAVMGCPVNGPGEAREADIGISVASDQGGVVFKKGKVVKHAPTAEIIDVFTRELSSLLAPGTVLPERKK